ncbi:MAG: branched-chain amino acid ABC transporter permease [Candidatus Dormiibacterota bacterium]
MLSRLRLLFRRGDRVEGNTLFWVSASAAAVLLLMGWLLPWFVTAFSGGVGYSPMDVVVSAPAGVAAFLLDLVGLAMLVLVLSPLVEVGLRLARVALPSGADRARSWIAGAGLVLTLAVWVLVFVIQEEPAFGALQPGTFTDSAVWLTMYGFGLAAFAYGARGWIATRPNLAFIIAAAPFGVLLPLMFEQAPDFLLWAAESLAIYLLLGLGLNVVVGFAGLLDLGYAAFFAIGAYVCASLASPFHEVHISLWLLIFIGAGVAATAGAILGAPTLRLRGDYLAIVTLGFGEIIPDLANNNFFNLTAGPNGISGIDSPSIGPVHFAGYPQWFYWALLIASVITVVMFRNLQRAKIGRAWTAIREDEVAAAATGINTVSTKLLAFAIGASVSGLAGAFYGQIVSIVSPEDFSFSVSVTVLCIVVLGGIGNITGVILGAFVLTFVIFWALPNANNWMLTLSQTVHAPGLANLNLTQYTFIIYGVALISMMLFRPGGLLPSRARRIEIEAGVETESLAAVQGRA